MATDSYSSIRASRFRVSRSRGATSGFLLVCLGAWAALAPLIGPYFNLAYTPSPDSTWHWTAARAWFEVAPGAAAVLGGLLLVSSTSRIVASLGGWLAVVGGAWLIIGPSVDPLLTIDLGTPDPASSSRMQAVESLAFFYAAGGAIVLLAGLALGRLSVLTVRDVQAAERRLAAEAAEDEETSTAYLREPSDGAGEFDDAPHAEVIEPTRGYPSSYSEPTYSPTGAPPSNES
ncbi:MAG TPA: hypothetical protein VE442_26595 [Jatrophihabitans sp.]|jgi:hypothetical protein|nr:hypothetical protein [Jatrophihabitans sp.]